MLHISTRKAEEKLREVNWKLIQNAEVKGDFEALKFELIIVYSWKKIDKE